MLKSLVSDFKENSNTVILLTDGELFYVCAKMNTDHLHAVKQREEGSVKSVNN